MKTTVVSVAMYAETDAIRTAVTQSDNIRHQVQDICKTVPMYDDLPIEGKNAIYGAYRDYFVSRL